MGGRYTNAGLGGFGQFSLSRWPIPLAAVVLLLVGLILVLACQFPREPVYHGKALTLWLQNYDPSSSLGRGSRRWKETDDAVRHIGAKSIPALLEMLRATDSKLKLRLVALAQRQRMIRIHFVSAAARNIEASTAFIALGDTAKEAVPKLMEVYHESNSVESLGAVEDALGWIGPAARPAIPLLLGAATNSNNRVRANALWALGEIHAEPQLCVPELIRALGDSNDWARISAVHSLGRFGADAQPAVPTLTEMANSPNAFMAFSVTRSQVGFAFSVTIQVGLEARKALQEINASLVSTSSENLVRFELPTAEPPSSPQ